MRRVASRLVCGCPPPQPAQESGQRVAARTDSPSAIGKKLCRNAYDDHADGGKGGILPAPQSHPAGLHAGGATVGSRREDRSPRRSEIP
jgi:hypothetical protein